MAVCMGSPTKPASHGRWNWWAPAPLRRFHDRFGIKEDVDRAVASAQRGFREWSRTPAPARGDVLRLGPAPYLSDRQLRDAIGLLEEVAAAGATQAILVSALAPAAR